MTTAPTARRGLSARSLLLSIASMLLAFPLASHSAAWESSGGHVERPKSGPRKHAAKPSGGGRSEARADSRANATSGAAVTLVHEIPASASTPASLYSSSDCLELIAAGAVGGNASMGRRALICDAEKSYAVNAAACSVDLAALRQAWADECESERGVTFKRATVDCQDARQAIRDEHRKRREAKVCTRSTCDFELEPTPVACILAEQAKSAETYSCQALNYSAAPEACSDAVEARRDVTRIGNVPNWKHTCRELPIAGALLSWVFC